MSDENREPRVWSLEEIDALLQDSGVASTDSGEKTFQTQKKAETVDPRPTHNDSVEHKIKSPEVERSDAANSPQVYASFSSDKYRDRFFNRPMQNIEKTSEHHAVPPEMQKYERAGFVKKKSDFQATADFEPVPTLVSDDMLESTKVLDDDRTKTVVLRSFAKTDGNAHEETIEESLEDDAQLSIEGFSFDDDIEKVDEREVEAKLIENRKEKVDNFVVVTEETESNNDTVKFGSEEYRNPDDKFKVSYFIRKKKRAALVSSVVDGALFLVLLIISVLGASGVLSALVCGALSLVLLAVAGAASSPILSSGLKSIVSFKFNRDAGCVFAMLSAAIQAVTFCLIKNAFDGGVTLFTASAVLVLALNIVAELLEQRRIEENFAVISSNELFSIGKIEQPETSFEIGRGLLLDEPEVICSQKTKFPKRFLELSRCYYPSDDAGKRSTPIVLALALVIGVVTGLISRNAAAAVSAFCASVCVGVPYFSYIADVLSISALSKKLLRRGAVISGWESVKETVSANAVAIDSSDVFDADGGNIFGIHIFYDMKADDAIIDTAALTVASGGPLGNLFKRVIMGKTELLPSVDTLAYEDKLGLSAWIFNRRVLVGSAELLKNHNVEIPDKHYVEKHLKEGRYPLYLAVDGKVAAVFMVSYDINETNRKPLRNIEKNNLSLLVRSDDANITDELVATGLDLPQSGVKVLTAVSGEVYKTYKNCTTTAADAGLMHDGRASSFLEAISGALSLGSSMNTLRVFRAVAMGVGLATVAVLAFVSGLSQLNCFRLVLTQALFTAVSLVAVKFMRH